ncbi:hypothetical protein OBBRIDRAFT_310835 [Obba rivulosa]|uniref:Uncharacterized protein n=1 Tax=Obba rivulosa TaxID=1052685 RepID=A0A8E2ANI1_9APHY|nr:hypothetical protein OBBRIDRAFT_310835 [Obba rivulosa]
MTQQPLRSSTQVYSPTCSSSSTTSERNRRSCTASSNITPWVGIGNIRGNTRSGLEARACCRTALPLRRPFHFASLAFLMDHCFGHLPHHVYAARGSGQSENSAVADLAEAAAMLGFTIRDAGLRVKLTRGSSLPDLLPSFRTSVACHGLLESFIQPAPVLALRVRAHDLRKFNTCCSVFAKRSCWPLSADFAICIAIANHRNAYLFSLFSALS